MNPSNLRVKFIQIWTLVQVCKLVLAACLPVFVDEAFYAWEGRHLAWAYSDLPGLTAWLARLGTELGGNHPLALRLPFLLLGAAVPWLAWSLSRRWFGETAGAQAGLLATLMPLSGLLGVLAVPDVPMVFAALLCLEAVARLRDRVDAVALGLLALALVAGALAHYRFVLVVFAGMLAVLADEPSRRLLRDARVWAVLAVGAAAWWPLLEWNLHHAGAGLRFQFIDRNPWQFHADGFAWLPIQFLLVTPVLFVLLLLALRECWRRRDQPGPWRFIGTVGFVAAPLFLLLGLFADDQRVSFHWPLSGWLALIVIAPVALATWSRRAKAFVFSVAALGLLAGLSFLAVASSPSLRERLADSRAYPADFAGWREINARMKQFPAGTRIVASDFELAAQLSFALGGRDLEVLDSPLNHKHGRAAQLQAWGLDWKSDSADTRPIVLVLDDSATAMKLRLEAYRELCRRFGPLPAAEVIAADHGRKRYFIYRVALPKPGSGCVAPALAWIDSPTPKSRLRAPFDVAGWAFKEGAGLSRIEILLDGRPVADAHYGIAMPNVADYWKGSTDPNQPNVGFRAMVPGVGVAPGPHWLGLRLHGADGSVEDWPEQKLLVEAQ
ncbi:MAG: glycosyltransferase family 39 protein [Gammaproteobacteria bacterium]|nr:glycosyltransferase family 39 protein [Gammaproteobacteria bacterium]